MSHWRVWATALFTCSTAVAGPLDPPAGPIAPTGKTLQEVQPRTPLVGDTIDVPGSYYLTGPRISGITITTAGVTLDLNGFTIAPATLEDAINYSSAVDVRPIVIKNGFIRNASDGIECSGASTLIVERVHITNCTRGILASRDAHITNSTVVGTSLEGILVLGRAVISDCSVSSGNDEGIRISSGAVQNCMVSECLEGFDFSGGTGDEDSVVALNCSATQCGTGFTSIDAVSLKNCSATQSTNRGFRMGNGSILSSCVASGTDGDGFEVPNGANTFLNCTAIRSTAAGYDAASGSIFTTCNARLNSGAGFDTGNNASLTGCVADGNGGDGFDVGNGCVLRGCTATANSSSGFDTGASCRIVDCTAYVNSEDGFTLSSDNRISDCVADGNGGGIGGGEFAGVRGASDTTIDSCTATDNPTGIIGGSGGLIIRCAAAGNQTNYDLGSSDHGEIISPAGGFSEANAFANISY